MRATKEQAPVGQTPVRQSYSQSMGEMEREVDFGIQIEKTNSSSFSREAGKRQKMIPGSDWQANFFKNKLFSGFLTSTDSVFYSQLCGNGFGRILFFIFVVPLFPFLSVCSFFFPFFFFSVSSSVCCSQIPENPFISSLVVGEGVRLGSGFLGLRVSRLKA